MKNNMIQEDIKKINIDLSKLQNKSVLITGASGLIGIYLLTYIKSQQEKYNITIYAWIKTSIDSLLEPLLENFQNVVLITGDISDKTLWQNIPKMDYIIHAAGYGQPNKFLNDKIKTIELNTTVTTWLFEKLKKDGSFLFISSSEIYDGLDKYNTTENEIGNTNTNHARACYIEGKRCGEAICYAYIEQGVDVKIIRLGPTYGPGTKKNDTRVINSLVEKGINNETINLLDSGRSMRTFCYITDSIEMIFNVFLFGKESIYNVGGTTICTIYELASILGKILGKKVVITDDEKELIGSPKLVNISINKYLNEFSKKQFVPLEEGLINTVEWQKLHYLKT